MLRKHMALQQQMQKQQLIQDEEYDDYDDEDDEDQQMLQMQQMQQQQRQMPMNQQQQQEMMMDDADEEEMIRAILLLGNDLLQSLGVEEIIQDVGVFFNDAFYIQFFQAAFPTIDFSQLEPGESEQEQAENLQDLIDLLEQQILKVDLSSLSGPEIIMGNPEHCIQLLQLLQEITIMMDEDAQGEEDDDEEVDDEQDVEQAFQQMQSKGTSQMAPGGLRAGKKAAKASNVQTAPPVNTGNNPAAGKVETGKGQPAAGQAMKMSQQQKMSMAADEGEDVEDEDDDGYGLEDDDDDEDEEERQFKQELKQIQNKQKIQAKPIASNMSSDEDEDEDEDDDEDHDNEPLKPVSNNTSAILKQKQLEMEEQAKNKNKVKEQSDDEDDIEEDYDDNYDEDFEDDAPNKDDSKLMAKNIDEKPKMVENKDSSQAQTGLAQFGDSSSDDDSEKDVKSKSSSSSSDNFQVLDTKTPETKPLTTAATKPSVTNTAKKSDDDEDDFKDYDEEVEDYDDEEEEQEEKPKPKVVFPPPNAAVAAPLLTKKVWEKKDPMAQFTTIKKEEEKKETEQQPVMEIQPETQKVIAEVKSISQVDNSKKDTVPITATAKEIPSGQVKKDNQYDEAFEDEEFIDEEIPSEDDEEDEEIEQPKKQVISFPNQAQVQPVQQQKQPLFSQFPSHTTQQPIANDPYAYDFNAANPPTKDPYAYEVDLSKPQEKSKPLFTQQPVVSQQIIQPTQQLPPPPPQEQKRSLSFYPKQQIQEQQNDLAKIQSQNLKQSSPRFENLKLQQQVIITEIKSTAQNQQPISKIKQSQDVSMISNKSSTQNQQQQQSNFDQLEREFQKKKQHERDVKAFEEYLLKNLHKLDIDDRMQLLEYLEDEYDKDPSKFPFPKELLSEYIMDQLNKQREEKEQEERSKQRKVSQERRDKSSGKKSKRSVAVGSSRKDLNQSNISSKLNQSNTRKKVSLGKRRASMQREDTNEDNQQSELQPRYSSNFSRPQTAQKKRTASTKNKVKRPQTANQYKGRIDVKIPEQLMSQHFSNTEKFNTLKAPSQMSKQQTRPKSSKKRSQSKKAQLNIKPTSYQIEQMINAMSPKDLKKMTPFKSIDNSSMLYAGQSSQKTLPDVINDSKINMLSKEELQEILMKQQNYILAQQRKSVDTIYGGQPSGYLNQFQRPQSSKKVKKNNNSNFKSYAMPPHSNKKKLTSNVAFHSQQNQEPMPSQTLNQGAQAQTMVNNFFLNFSDLLNAQSQNSLQNILNHQIPPVSQSQLSGPQNMTHLESQLSQNTLALSQPATLSNNQQNLSQSQLQDSTTNSNLGGFNPNLQSIAQTQSQYFKISDNDLLKLLQSGQLLQFDKQNELRTFLESKIKDNKKNSNEKGNFYQNIYDILMSSVNKTFKKVQESVLHKPRIQSDEDEELQRIMKQKGELETLFKQYNIQDKQKLAYDKLEQERKEKARRRDEKIEQIQQKKLHDEVLNHQKKMEYKHKNHETLLTEKIYSMATQIEKNRLINQKKGFKEQEVAKRKLGQNILGSIETFYGQKINMLKDRIKNEKFERMISQNAQKEVLEKMKRENLAFKKMVAPQVNNAKK